ncbi:MAG: serine hydrolase [Dysgonamonadaceae bacterium]|jgi:beta-glucosidase-like glycosyl hydrolase/CubicO group peptidase (beta-lactamase class C family)|nr:serine hydrolase [Dysgonamonadaceae bacterium]
MYKKRNFTLFAILFIATTLSTQTTPTLYEQADKQSMNRWVDSVFSRMTLDDKVGQLFMPIVESTPAWRNRVAGYIRNQRVGGILFSRGTLVQQAEATNFFQSITDTPLMISLDGEWGLAMRLTDAPRYPRNMIVGAIQDPEIIRRYGAEVARQCREMGIHVNFAPTVDVHTNPRNPVIGTRSFGENPETVAWQGIAYSKGLEANGVLAVAKHFPGHGDTAEDSHFTLPTILHDLERLDSVELLPFREFINAGLSGVMIGHLDVPALNTNGVPSSLCPHIGNDLLKNDMGFRGLTFTDGMAMQGVSNQPNKSVRALLAGNDVVLGVVNQPAEFESVKRAVEDGTISQELLEEKVRRILSYKYILNVHKFTPINTNSLSRRVNSAEAEQIQREIYDGAMTLIKNENDIIPLTSLDRMKIASVAIGTQAGNTFQQYLRRYGDVTTFQAANVAAVSGINRLREFDLIIFSIHANNISEAAALQELARDKKSILVFFTSPYRLDNFHNTTGNADAVLVAHDDTQFAQRSAAQGIFGGIAMSGKLPVSAEGFPSGTGIETQKTRLSFSMPEAVDISSERFAIIDQIAMEGVTQGAYPGCQILVAMNGKIIYNRAFGTFDPGGAGSEVTAETVYDVASITKVAATVPAIMKLFDERKLRLQDPISNFVPEARRTDKASTTIRMLLLHESGMVPFIPFYRTALNQGGDSRFHSHLIASQSSNTFNRPVSNGLYASEAMRDSVLSTLLNSNLRNRGRYRYSCLNFILLQKAIENISKTDLNTFVQENFFNRLGATSITFNPLSSMSIDVIPATENDPIFRRQHIRGYAHDEAAAVLGGIAGNAGLFSNANDLAKLAQMWLNGGEYGGERFLSAETVRLFTSTRSSVSRRGLGFDKTEPRSTAGPASPSTPIEVYGHTGFTGTAFWVDPKNDMIYIFLSNRVNPSRSPNRLNSMNIRERIQEELYRMLN